MKASGKHKSRIQSIARGRWTAYAAAAAASTFAAAHSAESMIHYSGLINSKIADIREGRFSLGAGAGSFVIRHSWTPYGSTSRSGDAFFHLYAGSPSVNGFVVTRGSASVSNLDRGDVMSDHPFVPDGGVLASNSCGCSGGIRGQFRKRGVDFIGFKFNNGAGDQYGWVRVKMWGASRNEGKLVDFAYADPGEKIVAGQKESDPSDLGLESLGGLAVGAAGMLAWRRGRRSGRTA